MYAEYDASIHQCIIRQFRIIILSCQNFVLYGSIKEVELITVVVSLYYRFVNMYYCAHTKCNIMF